MEKTIQIAGKDVKLKATATFLIIYQAQTGKDFIPSIMPIAEKLAENGIAEALHEAKGFQLIDIFNIVWALAKNADKEIPDPETWLDSFENFPLDKILPIVFDLLISSFFSDSFQKKTRKWIHQIPKQIHSLRADLSRMFSNLTSRLTTSKTLQSDRR